MFGYVQYERYRWSNSCMSSKLSLFARSVLIISAGIMHEMIVSMAIMVLT